MTSLNNTIIEELRTAVEEAKSSDSSIEERVHNTRRRCKRIRAYLRLMTETEVARLRHARELVRSAAARLSKHRDDHVLIQTWRAIAEDFPATVKPPDMEAQQRSEIESLGDIQKAEEASEAVELAWAVKRLKEARRIIEDLHGREIQPSMLDALTRSYKAGRGAVQTVIDEPSLEGYHDLRKNTKRFYYQSQYLMADQNIGLQVVIDRAHDLEDKLGDALNLSILELHLSEKLSQEPHDPSTISDLEATRGRTEGAILSGSHPAGMPALL